MFVADRMLSFFMDWSITRWSFQWDGEIAEALPASISKDAWQEGQKDLRGKHLRLLVHIERRNTILVDLPLIHAVPIIP